MDTAAGSRPDRPFTVLFVCTANQLRSPIAEHLLRDRVDALELPWLVTSAGTHAEGGRPLDPSVQRILAEMRIATPDTWTSHRLTAQMVEDAGLILTADRDHRGAAVRLLPRASARTFTLRQFARYTAAISPALSAADGSALVNAARGARGRLQPVDPSASDIADPAGRSHSALRSSANAIRVAIMEILGALPRPPQAPAD